jgi:hypothetical protein
MITRIIWIGKNNEMAVTPRSARGAGVSAAARPVVLPQRGRAAPPVLSPVRSYLPARGNLGGSALRAAPLFDATAERWIVPPSRMTRESGAAAELRHSDETPCLESPAGSLAPSPAGHLEAISEVLKMVFGLTVFGLIAGFFLVLA